MQSALCEIVDREDGTRYTMGQLDGDYRRRECYEKCRNFAQNPPEERSNSPD